MKRIEIFWRDTSSLDNEWHSVVDCLNAAEKKYNQTYSSIGYLVAKNERYHLIASSCDNDQVKDAYFNDLIMIPTSNVLKVINLHPPTGGV